jgi:flavin reductase (DIM6/NTAB) family NADH-FMN oxidoreductase RutF
MKIEPTDLPRSAAYSLFISTIVPRPIAFISTLSPEGRPNLAPFSFFMGVTSDPPTLAVAVGRRRGALKDTARNIEARGEFVVNVVTQELARPMVLASGDFGPEVNEFEEAGLSPIPSERVAPPRVKESPVHMECRLERMLSIGRSQTALIIGEVLLFHIDDDVWSGDDVDMARLKPLGRLSRALYAPIAETWELPRPELDPATGRLPRLEP